MQIENDLSNARSKVFFKLTTKVDSSTVSPKAAPAIGSDADIQEWFSHGAKHKYTSLYRIGPGPIE